MDASTFFFLQTTAQQQAIVLPCYLLDGILYLKLIFTMVIRKSGGKSVEALDIQANISPS